MIVGTVKETFPDEQRVAITPQVVSSLTKAGVEVIIEAGAGIAAGYPDQAYAQKDVRVVDSRADVFRSAELMVQVRGYGANPERGRADLEHFRRGLAYLGVVVRHEAVMK